MPAKLTHQTYGKSRVRLTKVTRGPGRHDLKELSVEVALEGDFDAAYTAGDNAAIVATDSMKNTVYALAADHPLTCIELFALALAKHFAEKYPQVSTATITVIEDRWHRLDTDHNPADHPHAFAAGSAEKRVCIAAHGRDGSPTVRAGIEDLVLLRSAGSAFSGFVRDEFTTLPDSRDRLLATSLTAMWQYDSADQDFDVLFTKIRGALLSTFAGHASESVQQTLHAMGTAALEAVQSIPAITLSMPNKHRIPFDLSPLGRENRNEIFIPIEDPSGQITATLERE